MLCGVWGGWGEEEEGVKPSEETGETPHTAQDGRRGSSNPICQAARRGPRARYCAESSARASRRARGSQEAEAEARRPRAGAGALGTGAREGRARDARGSAAVAAVLAVCAAGRRPVPWAGGCGGRPVPGMRGRASRWRWRPRFDSVSCSPAPFIVLCPWEEKPDVLEREREGWRGGSRLSTLSPGRCRRGPEEATRAVGRAPRSLCTPGRASRCRSEPAGRGRRPRRGAPACSGELFCYLV